MKYSKTLRILLSLFAINFFSLYLYFSSHPDHHRPPSSHHLSLEYSPHLSLSIKPWPILPSYLPWSHNSKNPPFGSCEAYFGNGFNQRVDPLKPTSHFRPNLFPSGGGGGWFGCYYSETLRSSICEGGRIRMIPDRIAMSKGGEKLDNVIGRGEDEELPSFADGAFEIEVSDGSRIGKKLVDEEFLNRYVEEGVIERHTMRGLIDSIWLVDANEFNCSELVQLDAYIREMKSILYGINESEPVPEACAQLTQEFFSNDTMRLLILSIPNMNFEARKDATRVVANLQRQTVQSRLIASDYLEANLDLIDRLITGYEDPVFALHYGGMLRECIRHQVVARYVLKSEHIKKFFDYIQLPNFDVASDVAATFKELMTRHKSTVAEFLAENYRWYFAEFNSKLLESTNYMTRRHAVKLLGDMLLDRSNSGVMIRYVSSKDNMRVLMNLLRESHKSIQIDAFHVFKLFVANQNKPRDIVNILCANRSKLLRFFHGFYLDKEDEMFEADKAQVVKEILELVPSTPIVCSGELLKKPIAV